MPRNQDPVKDALGEGSLAFDSKTGWTRDPGNQEVELFFRRKDRLPLNPEDILQARKYAEGIKKHLSAEYGIRIDPHNQDKFRVKLVSRSRKEPVDTDFVANYLGAYFDRVK